MKKLVASLLIFTIGFGVNGMYCKAEAEPTEKIAQTTVKENTEKANTVEANENKIVEKKR